MAWAFFVRAEPGKKATPVNKVFAMQQLSVRRTWKRLTAVCVSVVTASLFLACAGGPPKEKAVKNQQSNGAATVGQRVESGGIALTVEKVERRSELVRYQDVPTGREFLVAEVLIETTGHDEAPYNPLYFMVKNDEGVEHSASVVNPLPDSLKSGKLERGQKIRGTVVFEIEQGGTGLVLSYEPTGIGGEYKVIRVDLEK